MLNAVQPLIEPQPIVYTYVSGIGAIEAEHEVGIEDMPHDADATA